MYENNERKIYWWKSIGRERIKGWYRVCVQCAGAVGGRRKGGSWQRVWRHLGRKRRRSETFRRRWGCKRESSLATRGCDEVRTTRRRGWNARERKGKVVVRLVVLVSTAWKRGGFFYPWAEDPPCRRTCSGHERDWPISGPSSRGIKIRAVFLQRCFIVRCGIKMYFFTSVY